MRLKRKRTIFIHTNQPLFTSFYIKRYLFFAVLVMSQRWSAIFCATGAWGLTPTSFKVSFKLRHRKNETIRGTDIDSYMPILKNLFKKSQKSIMLQVEILTPGLTLAENSTLVLTMSAHLSLINGVSSQFLFVKSSYFFSLFFFILFLATTGAVMDFISDGVAKFSMMDETFDTVVLGGAPTGQDYYPITTR